MSGFNVKFKDDDILPFFPQIKNQPYAFNSQTNKAQGWSKSL